MVTPSLAIILCTALALSKNNITIKEPNAKADGATDLHSTCTQWMASLLDTDPH